MKLSTPTNITFWIALALGVVGIVLYILKLPLFGFLGVLLGLILLALGNLLKGL